MEGSKTITLTVTKEKLLEQIKEHSYYLGEALKSNPQVMELAAKLQAGDDDDTVLLDFVTEGSTKLGNILSRVVGKTTYAWDNSQGTCTYTINAVANFMDAQKGTLNDAMLNYVSVFVLSRWLNLIKADESTRFTSMLDTIEEDMRQLGAQRDKPKRSTATS